MRTLVLLFFVVVVVSLVVSAQPPEIQWSRTFGGDMFDECYSAQQTLDGGYVLVGRTCSFGPDCDFWLIKTDAYGDSMWSYLFNPGEMDICYSVEQTRDGGYVMAGFAETSGPNVDEFCLVKIDSGGNYQWSRMYGTTEGERCYSVHQTPDDGYILAGNTQMNGGVPDFWLVKTDSNGDTLWTQCYGGSEWEWCNDMKVTSDGGYILAGTILGSGNEDGIWIVKTDADGNYLWSHNLPGENCLCVQQTQDSGYVLAGITTTQGAGSTDFWLIKTDEIGDTLWTRTYGGVRSDVCLSVQQTTDEGFVLAGYTESFGAGGAGRYDMWLVKTNAYGDSLWSLTFDRGEFDICRSVVQTSDGGFIMAGDVDFYFVGDKDFLVVKIGAEINSVKESPVSQPREFTFSTYPNPFNPTTTITFKVADRGKVRMGIYNLMGQQVANLCNRRMEPGQYSVTWDAGDLPSGIYFCKMVGNGFEQVRKIVLLK